MADDKLVIAGQPLEVDLVDVMQRLDMNEAQILYDISGVVQEDFVPPMPEAPKSEQRAHEEHVSKTIRNPAFKRAVTVIAYLRKHPEADLETVVDLVGKARQLDVSLALAGGGEEDPQMSSPSEPESLNSSNGHSRSEDSGSPSTSSSDLPGESLEGTGTIALVTSSPASARET